MARNQTQVWPARKQISEWSSRAQLASNGFFATTTGAQAHLGFRREQDYSCIALSLASTPSSSSYTACRITEIEGGLPIAARRKVWHATATSTLNLHAVLRFEQAAPPPGLIENIGFWNAPLPSKGTQESPIPLTAIGLSRSYGAYVGLVAQDLDLLTSSHGLYQRVSMPTWLNPADWHEVRMIITHQHIVITVAQHAQPQTPIIDMALPYPLEPLAFEASIDNDQFPQPPAPVTVPDTVYLAHLDIQLCPALLQ